MYLFTVCLIYKWLTWVSNNARLDCITWHLNEPNKKPVFFHTAFSDEPELHPSPADTKDHKELADAFYPPVSVFFDLHSSLKWSTSKALERRGRTERPTPQRDRGETSSFR